MSRNMTPEALERFKNSPHVLGKEAEAKRAALRVKHIADAALAEGRDATPDEWREITANTATIDRIKSELESMKADTALWDYMQDATRGMYSDAPADRTKGARIGFSGAKAAKIMTDAAAAHGNMGLKSLLAAGSAAALPIDVVSGVIPQGRAASSLFDILPAVHVDGGDAFSYLRQSARDLRAAPVAKGATKPTSTVAVERINDTLRVVAHLVEGLAVYDLADNAALSTFVQDELMYGLQEAVAGQVFNGDGTAPNVQGVLNTSGVRTQAFATNAPATIRRALGQLEAWGYQPHALIMNPSDWLDIETTTLTTGAFMLGTGNSGAPIDSVERRLWSTRVALATQCPVGKAVALGRDAVTLYHDGGIKVDWDTGRGFKVNEVDVRAEGRFGVSVNRPDAVVVATLTA